MQAYALESRRDGELRILNSRSVQPVPQRQVGDAILDQLVAQLADLVAEKVAARLVEPRASVSDEWLDTRRAAEYLGIHRDRVRRLAAEGTIPAEQASTGCKLYFRKSDLDAWRCPSSSALVPLRGGRDE